jgi:hypothetical protein
MKRTRRYSTETNSLYPTYSTRRLMGIRVLHAVKTYGVWVY